MNLRSLILVILAPLTLRAAEPLRTPANVPVEITFTAQRTHADPFNEVTLDVAFTDAAGTTRKVPSFWAGGDKWKVRYASPLTGEHRWQSVCSDVQDAGLHGVAGVVEVAPYAGNNPLFKNGPVRVAADRRHFEHADGTPFFWLGDTWWMGLCHRLQWPDEFQRLTADRVTKGFNVVQIVAGLYPDMPPFDPRGTNEAGFPWEKDYARIRPEYFDAADARLRHLTEQGITPCIVGAWGYFMPWMGVEKMNAHWRYLIARYGAMPVIWCAAGEANLPWYLAKNFPSDDRAQVHGWTEVLRYIRATDPFRRPLTIHPTGIGCLSARNATDDVALLDFDFLQTPHGQREAVPPTVRTMRESYADKPEMPIINGEAAYEMLSDTLPTEWTRAMFWLCLMNGAKGHTYGANGIWQLNRPGQPHGPSPTAGSPPTGYGVITWEDAMNLPGSTQMAHGKRFFESLPWTQLTPMPESVAWADAAPGDPLAAPQACGIEEKLRAIYILDPRAIVVRKLAPGAKYQLTHFDPVKGERTAAPAITADAQGEWRCEPPAHGHDWVLLLERSGDGAARKTDRGEPRDTLTDAWPATDALGRALPLHEEGGARRADKFAGIFYFNWQGSFAGPPFNNARVFDNTKLLASDPAQPAWGPPGIAHYWGESRFGYYRPDDPWVLRKHAQMLADAGVDVIIFDVTNGATYDAEREALCTVFEQIRAEGGRTPQIAFLAFSDAAKAVVARLWETLYQPGRHRALWFQWKGKPLLLTPPEALTEEMKAFFAVRTSWAWTRTGGGGWFADGRDKWPWLDTAPQGFGWHESPDKAEAVAVGVAQHATSNIGRSFHAGGEPSLAEQHPEQGLYFAEQWQHALPLKPEFIFITGWNEWIAGRFLSDGKSPFLGRILPAGETFFVDAYTQEYSRDIEPMRGGHGDNYYWQMAAGIRRFKGARPVPPASAAKTIAIPGDFAQWADVRPVYLDDLHDTTPRDHNGVAGAPHYINRTGRNDLDTMHVAHDTTHLYFHATARDALTPSNDARWMVLFLDTDCDAKTGWLGYEFRVNQTRTADTASIERWDGAAWQAAGTAKWEARDRDLHLAVPRAAVGLEDVHTALRLDFKWADNLPESPDALDFLDQGDTAPNARFNYRYTSP